MLSHFPIPSVDKNLRGLNFAISRIFANFAKINPREMFQFLAFATTEIVVFSYFISQKKISFCVREIKSTQMFQFLAFAKINPCKIK